MPISEFDEHAGDQDWLDEGDEIYEDMVDQLIEDYGPGVIDQQAVDLLYDGWFNPDTEATDRYGLMFDFFEVTGIEWDDFNWDEWRDWYES